MRKAPRRIAGTAQAMRKTHLSPMFTIARAKRRAAGKAFRVFLHGNASPATTIGSTQKHLPRRRLRAPALYIYVEELKNRRIIMTRISLIMGVEPPKEAPEQNDD